MSGERPSDGRDRASARTAACAARSRPTLLLIFIVGDILGGGIYALVGEVGAETGGAIWSAFLLALIMAAFTAGSYAELVSKYPHAGGAALYVNRAFKNRFLSFIVAFAVVASGITSASALARGFGGDYLSEFVDLKVVIGALRLLALIMLVNLRGISESVKLNVGFTLVEVGGLLLIVLIAVVAIVQGDADTGRAFEFKEGTSVFAAMLAGAALAFYALVGFEDSVNVAEETQRPEPHLPEGPVHRPRRSPASSTSWSPSAPRPSSPPATSSASSGPLLEVVKQGPLGIPEKLFSAIGLLALSNGALINMIMASRLLYGMAKEDVVPAPLGIVGSARRTPWVAILFTTAIAAVLIITGDLSKLADTTVALLVLRVRDRQHLRARPAPRPGRSRALPGADGLPGARGRRVDRAADPDRGRGLGARRDPDARRAGPLAAQRARVAAHRSPPAHSLSADEATAGRSRSGPLVAVRAGRGAATAAAAKHFRAYPSCGSGGKHSDRFCFEGDHPVAVLRAFDKARVAYRLCFRKAGERQALPRSPQRTRPGRSRAPASTSTAPASTSSPGSPTGARSAATSW